MLRNIHICIYFCKFVILTLIWLNKDKQLLIAIAKIKTFITKDISKVVYDTIFAHISLWQYRECRDMI